MIEFTIPGRGNLAIHHLVCDVEGTLAVDGRFRDDLFRALLSLQDRLEIHLVTVDAFGFQDQIDRRLNLQAHRIQADVDAGEIEQKAAFVESLGAEHELAVLQGADYSLMLSAAGLAICVLSDEGVSPATLNAADLIMTDMALVLEALLNPLRIVNSLRV